MDRIRAELDLQRTMLGGHEQRIVYLDEEMKRTRERLHRVEGDRQAIKALVEMTRQLGEQTRVLAERAASTLDQAEELAEAAAEKAVRKAFGRRSESWWKLATRLATSLAALGTVGYLIAYLFIH